MRLGIIAAVAIPAVASLVAATGNASASVDSSRAASATAGKAVPVPAGDHVLKPGQEAHWTVTGPDGKKMTVTLHAGKVRKTKSAGMKASTDSGATAAAAAAAESCWEVTDSEDYGLSSSVTFNEFADEVSWCGNGNKIPNPPTNNVTGTVTTAGAVDQWQYDGIISGPTDSEFYDGWAYQTFVQGKFEQCILSIGCDQIQEEPVLQTNVYADGTYELYYS